MFVANMLVEGIKKLAKMRGDDLPKGENDPTYSTNRYQQYASKMTVDKKAEEAWVNDTDLDKTYLTMLKKVGQYQVKRNEAAHETANEFAQLLLSPRYKDKGPHMKFGPMFNWVYSKTVHEAGAMLTHADAEDLYGEHDVS